MTTKYPKITKLTPEQTARLADYRDKWIRIALSTGRIGAVVRRGDVSGDLPVVRGAARRGAGLGG